MKTTLTFEGDDQDDQLELEHHLRGPSLADALSKMHAAVHDKVHGKEVATFAASPETIPPAEDPPESWQEVLDLLNEHTGDVSDLLSNG